jgi:outer membrane protein OmpA-like peptidoglycan-associated protein
MKLNYNDKKFRVAAKIVILAMLFCGMCGEVSAQQVTISNNLLYDAWLTPNLRVGVRLAPHWSAGLTAGYNPWPSDESKSRKWKHLLVSPSVRYWTDSVNVHHFFGVNLIYSHYNVADVKFPFGLYKSVRDERRQGDLGALGVFYGYSWPIARHWNIEALIGAAVGYTKYDRYECGHCGTKIGDDKKWFVMPQAALNIVFNIPGRPKKVTEPISPVEPIEPVIPVTPTEPTLPIEQPQPVKERAIDILQREEPVVAHISEYKAYDRSQVLRRDKRALFVYFPQAKTDIQPDYRGNQQTLDRIIDVTRKMLADEETMLCKIQIVGLASFDGGKNLNERISKTRAEELKKYIQDRLSVSDDQFETSYGGEDWADFRDEVEEEIQNVSGNTAMVSQLKEVIQIIDSEPNEVRREQKIRKLRGGRTYQYIKEHHLDDQRNAGYLRIYFDYTE